MFGDLPEYLQGLNTIITSPPSPAVNQESENALWDYLHADELWANFGVAPNDEKLLASNEKEEVKPEAAGLVDLASFVKAFGNEGVAAAEHGNSLPLPLSYSATAGPSTASTPAGINTAEIMPFSAGWDDATSEEDRISGAKKLKELGAGQVEIEEDKRRRNTEASARFRAKKKERETALEQRSRELEAQVAQLAADKASLENENKLLKVIVLGSVKAQGQEGLQAALTAFSGANKRKRD